MTAHLQACRPLVSQLQWQKSTRCWFVKMSIDLKNLKKLKKKGESSLQGTFVSIQHDVVACLHVML